MLSKARARWARWLNMMPVTWTTVWWWNRCIEMGWWSLYVRQWRKRLWKANKWNGTFLHFRCCWRLIRNWRVNGFRCCWMWYKFMRRLECETEKFYEISLVTLLFFYQFFLLLGPCLTPLSTLGCYKSEKHKLFIIRWWFKKNAMILKQRKPFWLARFNDRFFFHFFCSFSTSPFIFASFMILPPLLCIKFLS